MQNKTQRSREQEAADKLKAEQSAKSEYFITDPNMRNVGNVKIKPGQKTVILSKSEAAFFLGTGLSTVNPDADAKAEDTGTAAEKPAGGYKPAEGTTVAGDQAATGGGAGEATQGTKRTGKGA